MHQGVISNRTPASLQDTLVLMFHVWSPGGTHIYIHVYVCLSVSVIQVLFLPRGGGDCAVWVHDDLCTADDHGHQQQAKEGDAGQSQALVHVHEGWFRSALHLHDCCCLLLLSSDTPAHPATILKTRLETRREGKKMSMLSHVEDRE